MVAQRLADGVVQIKLVGGCGSVVQRRGARDGVAVVPRPAEGEEEVAPAEGGVALEEGGDPLGGELEGELAGDGGEGAVAAEVEAGEEQGAGEGEEQRDLEEEGLLPEGDAVEVHHQEAEQREEAREVQAQLDAPPREQEGDDEPAAAAEWRPAVRKAGVQADPAGHEGKNDEKNMKKI